MVLSFFVGIGLVLASLPTIRFAFREIKRAPKKLSLTTLLVLLIMLGLGVGLRFCAFAEFQIGERMRVQGFPIPLGIFILEADGWTGFVKPQLLTYLCLFADAVFPATCLAAIFAMTARASRRRRENRRGIGPT